MDGKGLERDRRCGAYIPCAARYEEGDLAKFVEEAVRWHVLHQTVAETKARNSSASGADMDAAIVEALAAVRAERFDPHGG